MFSSSVIYWKTSMTKLRCMHCDICFTPAPQVPSQAYCSKPGCQKERRRQWQKNKLQTDPDYRDNQARAQKAWTDKNPNYWRNRRLGSQNHGDLLKSEQDSVRPKRRNTSNKMDLLKTNQILREALHDGVFRLKVLAKPDNDKMDVWIVELSSINVGSSSISHRVKR